MSLSCMELQLDQWLLTKGKSSTGENLNFLQTLKTLGVYEEMFPGIHWILELFFFNIFQICVLLLYQLFAFR